MNEAQHFGSIHKLAEAGIDELTAVPAVGEKIAQSVVGIFPIRLISG